VAHFSQHRGLLDEDSLRRLERNPLRILDSKNPELRELIDSAPLLSGYLDAESREHFERLQTLLTDTGIEFRVNARLVRGLDYYSRTVFEWLTDKLGAQSAVCSGGRYDGLVAQLGGHDTPAVGWALGIERIVELMRAEGGEVADAAAEVLLISVGEPARRRGFAVAEALRSRVPGLKLSIGVPSAGFKAQLRRADKSGARFAVIIGDEELAADRISVKPLREDSPQELLEIEEFAARLRAQNRIAG
jgi:histidyl-tRNA synthetase